METIDRVLDVFEDVAKCHRELKSMVEENTAWIEKVKQAQIIDQSNICVVSKDELVDGYKKTLEDRNKKIGELEKQAEDLKHQVINREHLGEYCRKILAEHKEKIAGLELKKEGLETLAQYQRGVIESVPKRSDPEWTCSHPIQSGFYWFNGSPAMGEVCTNGDVLVQIFYEYDIRMCKMIGKAKPYNIFGMEGSWNGPIESPSKG